MEVAYPLGFADCWMSGVSKGKNGCRVLRDGNGTLYVTWCQREGLMCSENFQLFNMKIKYRLLVNAEKEG